MFIIFFNWECVLIYSQIASRTQLGQMTKSDSTNPNHATSTTDCTTIHRISRYIFNINSLHSMPKYTCNNWKCGKCSRINRTLRAVKCEGCGADKQKGESLDRLPGDWRCKGCGCNNFARKRVCYKCNSKKVNYLSSKGFHHLV